MRFCFVKGASMKTKFTSSEFIESPPISFCTPSIDRWNEKVCFVTMKNLYGTNGQIVLFNGEPDFLYLTTELNSLYKEEIRYKLEDFIYHSIWSFPTNAKVIELSIPIENACAKDENYTTLDFSRISIDYSLPGSIKLSYWFSDDIRYFSPTILEHKINIASKKLIDIDSMKKHIAKEVAIFLNACVYFIENYNRLERLFDFSENRRYAINTKIAASDVYTYTSDIFVKTINEESEIESFLTQLQFVKHRLQELATKRDVVVKHPHEKLFKVCYYAGSYRWLDPKTPIRCTELTMAINLLILKLKSLGVYDKVRSDIQTYVISSI